MATNEDTVYTTVGLRDLFSNPNRVWVVMASLSPHRPRILRDNLGITNLLVMGSGFEEDLDKSKYECAGDYCADTAENKGRIVSKMIFTAKDLHTKNNVISLLSKNNSTIDENFDIDKIQIVIAADTLVYVNGQYYEKPVDRDDAKRQISSYPGVYQNIYTGIAIFVRTNGFENPAAKFYDETKVKYQKMTNEDVEALLDANQYQGSSGSYRLTMFGESLIEEMIGSYTNVVGLPAQAVSKTLCEIAKNYGLDKI
ncbi:hypothetical protein MACJ_003972 [Theileria orientalis]|uniref:Maf-like protein n=1 Tax=Theileria orientalis TaxID=68886 RepID=A0A976XKH4_THEOR|nr:hypothetical protein MACJ_003972 [Theileria orientalis]